MIKNLCMKKVSWNWDRGYLKENTVSIAISNLVKTHLITTLCPPSFSRMSSTTVFHIANPSPNHPHNVCLLSLP